KRGGATRRTRTMLARAAAVPFLTLLLVVTSLGATLSVSACPNIVEPLAKPSATHNTNALRELHAALDDETYMMRLAQGSHPEPQPLEPEPEEMPIDANTAPGTDDIDDPTVAQSGAPPCDGELDEAAMEKRATASFVTNDENGGIACLEEVIALDPQNT